MIQPQGRLLAQGIWAGEVMVTRARQRAGQIALRPGHASAVGL